MLNICQKMTNKSKIIVNNNQIVNNKTDIICKFCNKTFNIRQTKWYHEKKCKLKYNEINEYKLKIKELENNKNTKIFNNITNNLTII